MQTTININVELPKKKNGKSLHKISSRFKKVLSIRVSGGVDSVAMLKKMRISVHNPFNQSTLPVFVQPSPLHKGFLIKKILNLDETFQYIYELTYGFPTLAVVVQSDLMKNQLQIGAGKW